MRFDGTLTSWNDERGYGHIESSQGGQPIFVHISAWPRGAGRPQLNQSVSFEMDVGPKGKRAREVRLHKQAKPAKKSERAESAQWGTATLFAIPLFLIFFGICAVLWQFPLWVAGLYLVASLIAFIAYALDKAAAKTGSWRIQESSLHILAFIGGWPGALLAQQLLRHKSTNMNSGRCSGALSF